MLYRGYNYSFGYFNTSANKVVKAIIIINIAVFVFIHLFSQTGWLYIFGLVPALFLKKFMFWQVITYMFLHIGLWHLVLNMLMLWFFAPAIEASWGRREFLKFYLFCGIVAGLCSFLVSPHSTVPVIGASGAIFGVLVAYALVFPDTAILLFFFFPMKMKHAVVVLVLINLLGAISSPYSGIAYFAHLGGGLFGYLYLKREYLIFRFLHFDIKEKIKRLYKNKSYTTSVNRKRIDEEIDRILDKISREGMQSLTEKEKKLLKWRSKQK